MVCVICREIHLAIKAFCSRSHFAGWWSACSDSRIDI